MSVPRARHTATLLLDGSVLVTGGTDGTNVWSTAERYFPSTGKWSIAAPMHVPRAIHTATRLSDGRVLVVGGASEFASPPIKLLDSAEIYDPSQNQWKLVASMHLPRGDHLAALLLDGRVLVVNGGPSGSVDKQKSAEVYDATTDTWTRIGNTGATHLLGSITRLLDGSILVAGGFESGTEEENPIIYYTNYSERYVPDGGLGRWLEFSVMHETPAGHGASLLGDGTVLVTGGMTAGGTVRTTVRYRATQSLSNFQNNVWQYSKDMLSVRSRHTQTTLSDGTVLVVGGSLGCLPRPPISNCAVSTPGAELFQPIGTVGGIWTKYDFLHVGRSGHTATSLKRGCGILVVGGYDWSRKVVLDSAEFHDTPCLIPESIYHPGNP
jgi:hypothetical protein